MYLCTGMIYAAVKAIAAWAHAITPLNFLLLGLASGLTLASALAAAYALPVTAPLAQAALVFTLAGAATRGWTLWRNLTLAPAATLQSAIGVRHPRIVQISQGMTAGSFGTREFFHGAGPGFVQRMRWAAALLGFALPAVLLMVVVLAAGSRPAALTALAFVAQSLGLLAERWCFFAEGQHTQNLYHSSMRT
jgi:sulfite dehydrogenase (quinone) subunit SoeC